MNTPRANGALGERSTRQLLLYGGWTITEEQPLAAGGHRLDFAAKDPNGVEWLVEVKVWQDIKKVGTDNIKKAIGVAYDMRAAGETRPLLLVLSHELAGLHAEMLRRALHEGVITEIKVLALVPLYEVIDADEAP